MRAVLGLTVALTAATALLAHEGVKDPEVKARMQLMMQVKTAMGTLGEMANGAKPFDAAKATKAQQALASYATQMPARFETPATDPKSEALPTIWTSWPEFTGRASNMHKSFSALDASSRDALRAGLADAANTCRSCHQSFRMKQK